jgi:hypothetical protein
VGTFFTFVHFLVYIPRVSVYNNSVTKPLQNMNTTKTSAFSATTRAADKEYIVIGINSKEHSVLARTPYEALGIFLKRGRHGLGTNWRLTRQPDGWIVAVNTTGRNLERKMHKLREKNYTRGMR